ncbi:MAG TPA: hypothetical protein VL361_15360 [Candidatus Limnocylindrales bacterium]|nr:hypothetical protein [Candidatus Limnocylindrales bacterium]
MIHPEKVVTIHPYFRVFPGKMTQVKELLRQMVARTLTETANLYYDFTINGDVVFCREAYVGAEGLLTHVENIRPLLAEVLKLADVLRLEVHGTSANLEKVKGPLATLKPEWFVFECGVVR